MNIINHIEMMDGQAVIRGHGHLKAKMVARMHLWEGVRIDEVMAHYGLTAAEVHSAIAYYYDNQAVLDEDYEQKLRDARAYSLIQQNPGIKPVLPTNIFETDFQRLVDRCKTLPPAKGNYLVEDFMENLFITVLDFQLRVTTVDRALEYYRRHTRQDISDLHTLKKLLVTCPDTKEGNLQLAQTLWGYNLWTRAELLRRLVEYFEGRGVTTQEQLKQWATQATFERDFQGKIKGMGFAIFNWIVMRQGVETIKPDLWIHRFIVDVFGSAVTDDTAVKLLQQVAKEMGIKAYELDWRIWEHMTGRS